MNLAEATEKFMRAAGQTIATNPHLPDDETRILRRALLIEEVSEYYEAEENDDLTEIVDGLIDIMVVATGTLLAYVGTDAMHACIDEVIGSNLAKIVDGKVHKNAVGKIMKPDGWTPPDIAGLLMWTRSQSPQDQAAYNSHTGTSTYREDTQRKSAGLPS